ncbi:MAG: SDR family NAD(P)-dependent oxidoreductase [Candidatus Marivariicella sp.]|tara:strand:+ start:1466 stop:2236 length:771 start_codon:yes stop_codon:yes gene_type:complete
MNSKKLFELNGKVAIVTGSSKGIGLAIARGLSENGANVVLSSRSQEKVELAANQFQKDGLSVLAQSCHVGDEKQRIKLVEKTIKKFGKIDILVNNAAINPVYESIENMSNEVYDKMFNVNVKAIFDLSNLCFPFLKKEKSGSIINIASVEGLKPSLGLGIYSVTKAAVIMLTQVQAKEWGKHGIRSNAICPGLIKTKFSKALWENQALLNQVKNQLPAGRVAEPEEMIGLALYLASSAGSYSTGGIYTADGGHMTI